MWAIYFFVRQRKPQLVQLSCRFLRSSSSSPSKRLYFWDHAELMGVSNSRRFSFASPHTKCTRVREWGGGDTQECLPRFPFCLSASQVLQGGAVLSASGSPRRIRGSPPPPKKKKNTAGMFSLRVCFPLNSVGFPALCDYVTCTSHFQQQRLQ